MRKGRDGEKRGGKKTGKKEKTDENSGHYVIASIRPPNADRWNAACSRQKTDDYSGHYVIASSRPPKRQPLERHPLVPKVL